MNIEKSQDLIKFINSEKIEKNNIGSKSVLTYFCKCCFKTITELSYKLGSHIDKNSCIVMGSKMFFYVFFIVLSYTNNLKLTMFLAERAILLYSEFIIMSNDISINNDLNYTPNISDALSFAYKKTIGPIQINDITNINILKGLKDVAFITINIYNNLYLYQNEIFKNISIIDDQIILSLYHIFNKLDTQNRDYIQNILLTYLNKDIETNLVIIKIIIDSFNKIVNINNNIDITITKKLFETIYIPLLNNADKLYIIEDIRNIKNLQINIKLKANIRQFKKLYDIC